MGSKAQGFLIRLLHYDESLDCLSITRHRKHRFTGKDRVRGTPKRASGKKETRSLIKIHKQGFGVGQAGSTQKQELLTLPASRLHGASGGRPAGLRTQELLCHFQCPSSKAALKHRGQVSNVGAFRNCLGFWGP